MEYNENTIKGADFAAAFHGFGEAVFELETGSARLTAGGVRCDGFGEERVAADKLKIHRTLDGIAVSAESQKVIPFGCEYDVRRSFALFDGVLRVTADFRPVGPQPIRELALDPVSFEGDFVKLGISRDGGEVEWHELPYKEETPDMPAFYLLEGRDGTLYEFGCGEDLWRCRAGRKLGGEAVFSVDASQRSANFGRLMFRFAREVELQRRPWRFSYYFAWSGPEEAVKMDGAEVLDLTSLGVPASGCRSGEEAALCFAAPVTQRMLRDAVRRSTGSLVIRNAASGICCDAGHLDRAGKGTLLHRDLDAKLAFYEWANRQLDKIGAGLVFEGGDDTASTRVTKRVPRKLA